MGPGGEQVGVVRVEDALRLAEEAGLDLVEVAPNAKPPVAKLMDYGKYKYEAAQKARDARRNQANTQLKEIRFRLKIDDHDFGVKKGHVERFLSAGDKVKVTGTSVGKGYQGRMRRWNFAGSKDTHGCEKVHRNNGSVGNNTFPGHVFKGRKMAGHWGNETVTELGLTIVDVRPEDNVILVKGSVPGPKNGLVLIRKQ